MNKKNIAAAVTLAGAGYWLWQKRPLLRQARTEIDETGQFQLGTLLALGLFALSAVALAPEVRKALRQLGRS
jgi:hypothetical protein